MPLRAVSRGTQKKACVPHGAERRLRRPPRADAPDGSSVGLFPSPLLNSTCAQACEALVILYFSFQEFLCAGGVWKFFLSPDDYQNRRLPEGSGNGRYCAVPGARRVTRRRAAQPGGAFPGRVRECEEVPQIARRCRGTFWGSRLHWFHRQGPRSAAECGSKKKGRSAAAPPGSGDHGSFGLLKTSPGFKTGEQPATLCRSTL